MGRLGACFAAAMILSGPAFSQSWDGPYGGLQLGYISSETSGASALDGDGALGGVHVGYDVDLGTYVVGGEVDYDTADLELGGGAATIDSLTRVKVRAGSDIGDALVYGTVGLAMAETSLGDDNGYILGAGVSQQFTNGWRVGGEVLYHEFEDIDGSGVDAEATTFSLRASFSF